MSDSDNNKIVLKRFDPSAIREVSNEENEYREREYPDLHKFLKKKSIECSSCGKEIRKTIVNDYKLCVHPALDVIICRKCEEFYCDGEFSVDEDGSDKYCRWCGQGGNLYCCSFCSVAICAKCVKRNLPRKYIKEIERDDWPCFVCNPEPIWSFRALCHAAKQYVDSQKKTQSSKRSRKAMDSDIDSDEELSVIRSKKLRKEIKSEDQNGIKENSKGKNRRHSEETEKKENVPKSHGRNTDSEESSPALSPKKKISKTRHDTDSEESSLATSVRKTTGRSRRAAVDSDESAGTPARRSSTRNRLDESTSVSAAKKRVFRSRKENTDSDRSIFVTPTKEEPTTSRRRNIDANQSVKKEKSLLELMLIDGMRDFRRFTKVVVKNQNDYEEKYLKNKKKTLEPDELLDVKHKFLRLLKDTKESIIGLENSFLNGLKTLESNDKLTNGDKTPDAKIESNDEAHLEDETTCLLPESEADATPGSIVMKVASESEADGTPGSSVMKVADGEPSVAKTSTLSKQCTNEKPGEGIAEELPKTDGTLEKSSDENIDEQSSMQVELSRMSPCSSSNVSNAERYKNPLDESDKEEVFEDAMMTTESAGIRTSGQNDHVSEKDEIDSATQVTDETNEMNDVDGAEILSKVSELHDSSDSSKLTDNEENAKGENECDISGIDILKSDMDEVKTKKERIDRKNETKKVFFDESNSDEENEGESRRIESSNHVEKNSLEDEARKISLDSSSGDESEGTELSESNKLTTRKENASIEKENKAKSSLLDSSSDSDENEGTETSESNNLTAKQRNADVEKEDEAKRSLLDSDSDVNENEEVENESNNLPANQWNAESKKEDEAKKCFLDFSSDHDENEGHVTQESNNLPVKKQNAKVENEDKTRRSLFVSSSDSDANQDTELHESSEHNSAEKLRNKRSKKENNSEVDDQENKAKRNLLNSSSSSNCESDEYEKDIKKLTNLQSLNWKSRFQYSSSDEQEGVGGRSEDEIESKRSTSTEKKKRKLSLKKLNNSLEQYLTDNNDSSTDDLSFSKFKNDMRTKEKSFTNKDDVAKKLLLASGSSDEGSYDTDYDFSFKKEVIPKEKCKKEVSESVDNGKKKKSESDASDDSTAKKKKKKSDWRNDALLRGKLCATDTSDEERMIKRARKKYDQKEKRRNTEEDGSSGSEDIFRTKTLKPITKKKRFVLHSSNSEVDEEIQTSSSSRSSDENERRKKKPVKKRRRIKKPVSDDSDVEEINQSQSSAKGRKNIRQIMKVRDLDEETRKTAKEEEARKKRIAERQAMFNKVFNIQDTSEQAVTNLVLDYDPETKSELVTVEPKLLEKLKPHQAQGVKFMWDACFESLKRVEKGKGGGCILAHCMGLGKTLQVITLVHTLLNHEDTKVKTVLIICPLTTVLNWREEFEKWLEALPDWEDINIYDLTKFKNNAVRADHLRHWTRNGGIMILGYEMFRSLVNIKNVKENIKKQIISALLDPGPDLVICDEGHILKNEKSAISKATMEIKSLRRIVLTGTPLQNNLIEYHCMVQFVKPNLLGNKNEFQNRFVNPITNGQYVDSTAKDVRLMKRRAHVLHRMLDGIVQRFDYNVLKPFLPPKHEFVIAVGLSDLQAQLYEYYIKNKSQVSSDSGSMRLFKDYQIMRLIWTHPLAMKLSADRHQKIQEKEEDEESLKNFVVSGSESDSSSDSNSVVTVSSGEGNKKNGHLTRARRNELGIDLEEIRNSPSEAVTYWWNEFVSNEDLEDYKKGPKLMLLFAILRQCELIGDKVLVFSQSIPSLDMIEYFLTKNDEFSQRLPEQDSSFLAEPEDYMGTWEKNRDYFRLDGQTPNETRAKYCKIFNRPDNTRARLFLISTKAGGLGINLTAANRVIIFDASWNPSYDIQSIFRVYRFGQNKPCYIYRFLSQGTMEEKIYERQITKLSVSCRVVDEQQIDRHFSRKDITELYTFNRKPPMNDEIPKLPSDRLMAELLKQYKDVIINYHEHDSLLENIEEEELTEEERKAAWKDYEEEKNRPPPVPQMKIVPNVIYQEVNKTISDQSILATIKKLHPNASQAQVMSMVGAVREKLFAYYMNEARRNPNQFVLPSMMIDNDAQNPATEKQMQETLQMKQAALLHALQAQVQAPPPQNLGPPQPIFVNTTRTMLPKPSSSNSEGPAKNEFISTKLNQLFESAASTSSIYSTPKKSGYGSSGSPPFLTPTKSSLGDESASFSSPFSTPTNKCDSPMKESLRKPSTWCLRWNSLEKDPKDLMLLIEMQCGHWKPSPKLTMIGNSVLLHLGFCVRRNTLEYKLSRYGVTIRSVQPDFETGESLLGYPPRSLVRQLLSDNEYRTVEHEVGSPANDDLRLELESDDGVSFIENYDDA